MKQLGWGGGVGMRSVPESSLPPNLNSKLKIVIFTSNSCFSMHYILMDKTQTWLTIPKYKIKNFDIEENGQIFLIN